MIKKTAKRNVRQASNPLFYMRRKSSEPKEFIEFVYLKSFYEFFIAQQRVSGEKFLIIARWKERKGRREYLTPDNVLMKRKPGTGHDDEVLLNDIEKSI